MLVDKIIRYQQIDVVKQTPETDVDLRSLSSVHILRCHNVRQNATTRFALPHLDEPPSCLCVSSPAVRHALCAGLHNKYYTDRQGQFQDQGCMI